MAGSPSDISIKFIKLDDSYGYRTDHYYDVVYRVFNSSYATSNYKQLDDLLLTNNNYLSCSATPVVTSQTNYETAVSQYTKIANTADVQALMQQYPQLYEFPPFEITNATLITLSNAPAVQSDPDEFGKVSVESTLYTRINRRTALTFSMIARNASAVQCGNPTNTCTTRAITSNVDILCMHSNVTGASIFSVSRLNNPTSAVSIVSNKVYNIDSAKAAGVVGADANYFTYFNDVTSWPTFRYIALKTNDNTDALFNKSDTQTPGYLLANQSAEATPQKRGRSWRGNQPNATLAFPSSWTAESTNPARFYVETNIVNNSNAAITFAQTSPYKQVWPQVKFTNRMYVFCGFNQSSAAAVDIRENLLDATDESPIINPGAAVVCRTTYNKPNLQRGTKCRITFDTMLEKVYINIAGAGDVELRLNVAKPATDTVRVGAAAVAVGTASTIAENEIYKRIRSGKEVSVKLYDAFVFDHDIKLEPEAIRYKVVANPFTKFTIPAATSCYSELCDPIKARLTGSYKTSFMPYNSETVAECANCPAISYTPDQECASNIASYTSQFKPILPNAASQIPECKYAVDASASYSPDAECQPRINAYTASFMPVAPNAGSAFAPECTYATQKNFTYSPDEECDAAIGNYTASFMPIMPTAGAAIPECLYAQNAAASYSPDAECNSRIAYNLRNFKRIEPTAGSAIPECRHAGSAEFTYDPDKPCKDSISAYKGKFKPILPTAGSQFKECAFAEQAGESYNPDVDCRGKINEFTQQFKPIYPNAGAVIPECKYSPSYADYNTNTDSLCDKQIQKAKNSYQPILPTAGSMFKECAQAVGATASYTPDAECQAQIDGATASYRAVKPNAAAMFKQCANASQRDLTFDPSGKCASSIAAYKSEYKPILPVAGSVFPECANADDARYAYTPDSQCASVINSYKSRGEAILPTAGSAFPECRNAADAGYSFTPTASAPPVGSSSSSASAPKQFVKPGGGIVATPSGAMFFIQRDDGSGRYKSLRADIDSKAQESAAAAKPAPAAQVQVQQQVQSQQGNLRSQTQQKPQTQQPKSPRKSIDPNASTYQNILGIIQSDINKFIAAMKSLFA